MPRSRPTLRWDHGSRRRRPHVAPGEIVGLIGHNGAGKTTLFDLISGFTNRDRGVVTLDGEDISDAAPVQRAVRGLARSFQEARLFPAPEVRETLAIALDRHLRGRGDGFVAASLRLPAATATERIVAERVEDLIEQLGLGRYAHTPTGHLSTGTRRIVELACTLATDPKVLLLDEPSAGVAERSMRRVDRARTRRRDHAGPPRGGARPSAGHRVLPRHGSGCGATLRTGRRPAKTGASNRAPMSSRLPKRQNEHDQPGGSDGLSPVPLL